ncbi:mucin-5AC-like [Cololabis saira]|uniref:mucin-5AC-like n=1 Tax=Cololabis saira TaxID=129043 RepID=UPI002AD4AE51|nr:mucin-5AC-like [Cololabis saira]
MFKPKTQISNIDVRVGDDVTLPCKDVKDFGDNCTSTTWLYAESNKLVALFEYERIIKDAGGKSGRLRVTKDCLLVLEKVTAEDEGLYICRQYSSEEQFTDSEVQLSVNIKAVSSSSTTTTTTTTTTQPPPPPPPPPTTRTTPATTENNTSTGTPQIIVAVILPPLLIVLVVLLIIRWRRAKERETQPGGNEVQTDPEDDVPYATLNYPNTNTGTRVQAGNPPHDTVTYSTVRVHSSSAAASTDPNNFYSTVQAVKKQ